ncbi:hypothetical protein [Geminicoccus flavidas]|uniref:hypothetical protein n=1 Tax=Geminicoccus flavidas TaxID=2506407 RepID=UPI001356795D|nr:hypothetical protein [Geminicoccus flavidas]
MIMNIPPFPIFGENLFGSYAQIKRSFYFWYFQMQRVCEASTSTNDFAFIDNIWATGHLAMMPGRTCRW